MGSVNSLTDILYIANDVMDIQHVTQEFKKINGLLTIDIADDGVHALDKLYGRNGEKKLYPYPKLILLDIKLPDMDGLDFLKTLRDDTDFNYTAVYILTALYNTQTKISTRNLNVTGYIIKPLEYSDALNIFWNLLQE